MNNFKLFIETNKDKFLNIKNILNEDQDSSYNSPHKKD